MLCSPPGSSVHEIFQARALKWVASSSSSGSLWPRDGTHTSCGSCIGRRILYCWATGEAQAIHSTALSFVILCGKLAHLVLQVCILQSVLSRTACYSRLTTLRVLSWYLKKKKKRPRSRCDAGKDWRQEKRVTEDEMVGWHHWFNGCELRQTPGDIEGQGRLACCSPWGCKESDMT